MYLYMYTPYLHSYVYLFINNVYKEELKKEKTAKMNRGDEVITDKVMDMEGDSVSKLAKIGNFICICMYECIYVYMYMFIYV
jgi:hypothetical protein